MNQHKQILSFIEEVRNAHSIMVSVFTKGSCLNFHLILKSVFWDATPYYNSDHVITKIGEKFYDITGENTDTKDYIPLNKFCKRNSQTYKDMYNSEIKLK